MTTVMDRDSIVDSRHKPAKRKKSHHVTCIMDTKCAKVPMHSCMVLER